MKHFGIITPPVAGHVNPFSAIGRELIRRGHRVTVFHMADLGAKVQSEGLEFVTIGQSDHPAGTLATTLSTIGSLAGLSAMRYTVSAAARSSEMFLRDAPQAIREHKVDALLVDQMEAAGASVANRLQLPYVTICNALVLNRENSVPPPFSGFPYKDSWFSRVRNRAGYAMGRRAVRPITSVTNRWRREWGLPPYRDSDDSFSPLAQISQLPAAFDFPRTALPHHFHYVGPFRDALSSGAAFPWERLTGDTIAYVSLGSMQGSKSELLRKLAIVCTELKIQAVISHGGALRPELADSLPGSHVVVPYAPQYEVIRRCQITLTHAGLNTVLDSLTHGIPLVAIPITYEQPAIARRIRQAGVGATLSLRSADLAKIRKAVVNVLDSATYRAAARSIQRAIQEAGGTKRAADIIENVI